MTATLWKIAADFSSTLNLKTAIWATSATLDSATDDDGVALPTGTYFLTLDRKSANKEYIKCTLTGTALTDIYHVSRQGALTSGTTKTHRKSATVEITDFAIIKKMLDLLDGTTDLNASVPLKYDGSATISNANHLATKEYVDGVAIAGGADASTTVKGITKMSVAPASAANPIAVGDNDGRVPTQDENDALAGTSGTPSTSNKYVTNDDTSATTSASKVYRLKASGKIDATMLEWALPAIDGSALTNVITRKNWTTTYTWNTASWTQNIAHWLGTTPKYVKINAKKYFSNWSASAIIVSDVVYNGTTASGTWVTFTQVGTTGGSGTSSGLHVDDTGWASAYQLATITFDATNIILTWTKTWSPNSANINLLWEATA